MLEEQRAVFAGAGLYPPPLPKGAAAWPRFLEWAAEYVKVLAGA